MEIKPIATIHSPFKEKFGIPRQSGRQETLSQIEFLPEFTADCVRELEGFSHVWLIFDFSLCHKEKHSLTVRPPRLGGNKRVGVFASRSPYRPNSLGLSSVELVGIDTSNGVKLTVKGADLLDGTPIFDVKPYLTFTDCHENAKCGYAEQQVDHKLKVCIPDDEKEKLPSDLVDSLSKCLADDPRPGYQNDNREYGMDFENYNVTFTVCDNVLTVLKITIH